MSFATCEQSVKKVFKQAVGSLHKARRIPFSNAGPELLDNTHWSPAASDRGKSEVAHRGLRW